MRTLALDLHRPNRAGSTPGLLVLAAAIVVLVAAMQYLDTLRTQGEALDERESAIAKQEAKFRTISHAHRAAGSGDARMAALMAQQRYATEPARDLIEGGWHPSIAFLTVDIVTAARQINMQFETRTVQEALSYADWLQSQPGTESVSIRRQTEKPGTAGKSVETSLQVTWRPFVAQAVAREAEAGSGASKAATSAASATSARSSRPAHSGAASAASPTGNAARPGGANR